MHHARIFNELPEGLQPLTQYKPSGRTWELPGIKQFMGLGISQSLRDARLDRLSRCSRTAVNVNANFF
jgi:hypothetical protein